MAIPEVSLVVLVYLLVRTNAEATPIRLNSLTLESRLLHQRRRIVADFIKHLFLFFPVDFPAGICGCRGLQRYRYEPLRDNDQYGDADAGDTDIDVRAGGGWVGCGRLLAV